VAAFIGVISQKGDVGKSTRARLVAREYGAAGWQVKIPDLDVSQGASTDWKQRRECSSIKPDIAVEPKVAQLCDPAVFEGQPPHSMAGTLEITNVSDAVILPTGLGLNDLKPSALLTYDFINNHIPAKRLAFCALSGWRS